MKTLLPTLLLSVFALILSSCETTQTVDGQEVIGVAKQDNKRGEWGGAVKFVGGGMSLDDEPNAYQYDSNVDYVDYRRGPVRFGFGNTQTFFPPEDEEEVEIQKIGFD